MKFCIFLSAVLLQGCRSKKDILNDYIRPPPRQIDMSPVVVTGEIDPISKHGLMSSSPTLAVAVTKGSFTEGLYQKLVQEFRSFKPTRLERDVFEVVSLASEPNKKIVAECKEVIEEKLKQSSFPGKLFTDFWFPDDGEDVSYKLRTAIFPLIAEQEVHCFRFDIADSTDVKISDSKSKSVGLFLKQDPLDDNSWEGDDRTAMNMDFSPENDDLDNIKQWLGNELDGASLGVRILEVIGQTGSGGTLELKIGENKYLILKRKNN